MVRWRMAIDLDKCSGCQACVVACDLNNNASPGNPDDAAMGRLLRWLHILPEIEGEYPHVSGQLVPMMCQHCERPPCTFVCPVSATYPTPEGFVAQIYWRCIGCRYCVNACPYTMKWFTWWEPKWLGELKKGTNPDVELRHKGVTQKCTFCHDRLQRAKDQARTEGRALRPQEYMPACVEACPTNALVFGDIGDPDSRVSQLAKNPRSFVYLKELGTKPGVFYLKSK